MRIESAMGAVRATPTGVTPEARSAAAQLEPEPLSLSARSATLLELAEQMVAVPAVRADRVAGARSLIGHWRAADAGTLAAGLARAIGGQPHEG